MLLFLLVERQNNMKAEAFIHITGALPAVNDHMMPTEVLISVWSFGNVLFYYCDYA